MDVLPCGANARPWRSAYVSSRSRLCATDSAESASTGVVNPPVNRLRRSAASAPTVRPWASGGSALKRWSTRSSARDAVRDAAGDASRSVGRTADTISREYSGTNRPKKV
ncbi:hypothetical protein SCALM49S_00297 [Streptomyces californicus]